MEVRDSLAAFGLDLNVQSKMWNTWQNSNQAQCSELVGIEPRFKESYYQTNLWMPVGDKTLVSCAGRALVYRTSGCLWCLIKTAKLRFCWRVFK